MDPVLIPQSYIYGYKKIGPKRAIKYVISKKIVNKYIGLKNDTAMFFVLNNRNYKTPPCRDHLVKP